MSKAPITKVPSPVGGGGLGWGRLYRTAMDALYRFCVIVAGGALVLISAVIPWGVFTRYVLNSAASWPEPMAILLTIVLTFFGAAACYRAGTHMSVSVLVRVMPLPLRRVIEPFAEGLVALVGLFMVIWGARLVDATWHQSIAEFPSLSVGLTYLPIPVGWRHNAAVRCRAPADRAPAAGRRTDAALRRVHSRPMEILIVVGTLLVCFALGVPIAYALGLGALAGAYWIGIPLEAVMLQVSSGVSKFAMLTIPFFVLAGAIMAEGGMARRLVAFANVLVGLVRVRGGLSAVNVLATTFLSGISGSAVADTSAIGSVMIPQMERTGYPRVFATNVTISASVQALLVPPSHNAVIYSLATGGTISIISLFMAGVMPGLLLGASLVVLCLVIAYRNGHPRGETVPLREAAKIAIDALWGLVTLAIILGGILGGIFTAIEAGAVACIWAFFVTMFIYRDYRWRDLPELIHRTMRTVAMVMTLIAFASSVGYVMALMQVPARVTALLLTLSSDKNVILFLINILLLVLGCLLDMAPSILIVTPILLPVVMKFGVDPVHFGMIMLLNLGIGLCHPPVGAILFVGCAVGRVTIEQVVREIWPFYGVMFFVLMLVTYIPSVSLWLPRILGL